MTRCRTGCPQGPDVGARGMWCNAWCQQDWTCAADLSLTRRASSTRAIASAAAHLITQLDGIFLVATLVRAVNNVTCAMTRQEKVRCVSRVINR